MASPFALLIFDCDGVLVDSEPIACRVDAQCFTDAGFPISTEELARRFTGKSAAAIADELAAQHGRHPPPGLDALRQAKVLAAFTQELQPIPGVADALAAIRLPRCVASSSHSQRIAHSLELTGLRQFFGENIYSATMVARGKPAPDLFLYAAQKMNTSPALCLVIEDSPAGVQAGKAAGMRVFGFTGGSHCKPGHADNLRSAGADYVFESMAELPLLLRRKAV
jgi:HAD superfamily hydrolase (TIGR01509 family)